MERHIFVALLSSCLALAASGPASANPQTISIFAVHFRRRRSFVQGDQLRGPRAPLRRELRAAGRAPGFPRSIAFALDGHVRRSASLRQAGAPIARRPVVALAAGVQ